MALITINGTPLSELGGVLARPSLRITRSSTEPDSAKMKILHYRPRGQSEIVVYNADSSRRFGGIVLAADKPRWGRGPGRGKEFEVSCIGFSDLLQRRVLIHRFPAQPVGVTIREAVARTAPDIDTSMVLDGPEMNAFTWNDYPLILIREIVLRTGYHFEVNAYKQMIFRPRQTSPAPADLTETSANYEEFFATWDDSSIRNVVFVQGGRRPSEEWIEETFDGNGITDKFRLAYEPFSDESNPLLYDNFPPQRDYKPTPTVWVEHDMDNPTPPSQPDNGKLPFTTTDGYIIQDNAGYTLGALHFMGGPGEWGQIGVTSRPYGVRRDNRFVCFNLLVHSLGKGILGAFDGVGVDVTDCYHGFLFDDDGKIHIVEDGVIVPLVDKAYAVDVTYAVRVILKEAGGARYEIQGGDYGAFGGTQWTELHDSDTGAGHTIYAGIAGHSIDMSVYYAKMGDPECGMTVTVDGVDYIVGKEDTENQHADVLVNPRYFLLRFFTTNIPPDGVANIEVRYRRAIPIFEAATDGASINALRTLTGETGQKAGRREFWVKDDRIGSQEAARERGRAELRQHSNTVILAEWQTYVQGYLPGQVVLVQLPQSEGLNQQFVVREVVEEHFNEDDYKLIVKAGSTIKGLNEYLTWLIQQAKIVDFEEGDTLNFIIAGAELAFIHEQLIKNTSVPDVSGSDIIRIVAALVKNSSAADIIGSDMITFDETLVRNDAAPFTGPAVYDESKYDESEYA